ncbi:MAG: tetrahydromethanopterin S-methyltransferase subunit A [Thaumarchaeota archaeon]|nr:tetrahydromethanopterin S-methyltransferase subunit A [Nitrososphaerota archaeon]|tara:strand:+ start:2999 stop:3490 length:492 start_codon:yes stop_codon:yes gene_type:complete
MTNLLVRFAGKICEILLPIKHDIFYGNENSSIAICTLSSINILEKISKSELMTKVVITARLFSENKGIETLLKYVLEHRKIKYIVLCGNDTKGHLPGHALLTLQKNGVDTKGRIIGARGKDPVLDDVTQNEISEFRKHVTLVDLIGTTEINIIAEMITNLQKA